MLDVTGALSGDAEVKGLQAFPWAQASGNAVRARNRAAKLSDLRDTAARLQQ